MEAVERRPAEELRHAELLHELPKGPVGGEGEVGRAVGEVVDGGQTGPVGEGGLVGFEDLFGGFGGGNNKAGDRAEAEVEERAMAGGELVEGFVGQGAEEVEMADDGKGKFRGWRERFWFVFGEDEAYCDGGN